MNATQAPAGSNDLHETTPMSYYGRPVIKAPPWRWYVGAYLFVGGLAGGSGVLALAARAGGNDRLARAALGAAAGGVLVSPVLLIADLRDPLRFVNMLRVFKITSPMSVGSWILTAFGGAATAAAAGEFLGVAPPLGRLAEVALGLLGPALSTYTAALLADTAVPVWHDAGDDLPFVFAGGALASAGASALIATPVAGAALARRLVFLGTGLELAALARMDRRLGPLVGEPYRAGRPGVLKQAARLASLAAVAGLRAARTSRVAAVAVGTLGLAGALCERMSIFEAGKPSANDPRYTIEPQRARLARAAAERVSSPE